MPIYFCFNTKQAFISKSEKYTNQEIDIDLNLFRTLPVNICFNSPRWYFHNNCASDLSSLLKDEHNELKIRLLFIEPLGIVTNL